MIHSKSMLSGFEHLFHLNIDREILEIGIFQLCMQMGKDLIAVSLIFFMYKELNYEIWQIFLFFFLRQLPFFTMHPFIGKFIEKFGIKHSISIRGIIGVVFYLSLPFLLTENFWQSVWYLMPLFVIRGFSQDCSNVAYDIFIAKHINKKNRGSGMASIQIAIMAGAVLAPITGAIVTTLLGFGAVTYFGAMMLVVGSVVLYMTPDEKFKIGYTPTKLVKDTFRKTPKYFFQAESGRIFFDSIIWILWPVFLLITLGSLVSMGSIIGFASGIAMVFAFFVGKNIDKEKNNSGKVLKNGAYRSTILNFFRAFWVEPITLAIIDALNRINDQSIKIPYSMQYYKWIHKKDTIERAHIARFISELFYSITLGFFFVFFWLFSGYEAPPRWIFITIFSLGALAMTLTTRIEKLNKVEDFPKTAVK